MKFKFSKFFGWVLIIAGVGVIIAGFVVYKVVSLIISIEIILIISLILGLCLISSGIALIVKSNHNESNYSWSNEPSISILDTQEENTMIKMWNTDEINTQLIRLKDTGNPLKHFVGSVVERFITGQDIKTEKTRSEWLKERLEQLNLANAYADAMHEGRLKEKHFQKDSLTIDLDIRDLELKDELRGFDKEDAVLGKKISIAEKQKKLQEIENPPSKADSSEKDKIKAEIGELQTQRYAFIGEKTEQTQLAHDEDHRLKIENKFNHKIDELEKKIAELKSKL